MAIQTHSQVRIPGVSALHQGQLVLAPFAIATPGHPGDNNRPAERAVATSQSFNVTMWWPANREASAWRAAPSASSITSHALPLGGGEGRSVHTRVATWENTARTSSRRLPMRRIHPRTVAAGIPNVLAILRCPHPRDLNINASTMICAEYPRRANITVG